MRMVRTSERRDFVRCRQKWWWAYVEHLTSLQTGQALKFGDLVHQCLAAYYPPGRKRGIPPHITWDDVWDAQGEGLYGQWSDEGEFQDAHDLGHQMLLNYEQHYGKDRRYEIVCPEMAFQVDLYDSDTDDFLCTYVGQLDAVALDLDVRQLCFLEHKTTKGLPPDYWLPMDEQAGSYFTFGVEALRELNILPKSGDVDYIMYNFLRKGMKDARPQDDSGRYLNQDGSVSKRQPAPLFHREKVYRTQHDREELRSRIEWQVWEMEQVRDGRLPVYKNPTSDCRWQCQFRDMCELHEAGADWEAFRDAMFTTWEPYSAHEGEVE